MSEAIYDAEIAPLLAQVGELCRQNGMAFVAAVEYAPGETGQTFAGIEVTEAMSAAMRLAFYGVRASGNIDSLVMAAMRWARKTGHSSVILKQLGVPLLPASTDTQAEGGGKP